MTTTMTTIEEIIVHRLCEELDTTTTTSSKNNVNGQENMTKRRTDRLHKVISNYWTLNHGHSFLQITFGYCGDGPTGTTLSDATRHSI